MNEVRARGLEDSTRTMCQKPRAARNLMDSFTLKEMEANLREIDGFKFPPPPQIRQQGRRSPISHRLSDVETSDSTDDSTRNGDRSRYRPTRTKSLSRGYLSEGSPAMFHPPIGVFWDIENCQIPRGKSAVAVTQAIRDKFFDGYREAEFIVVCDVRKESPQVVQELNDAQVNLIHVASTSKNAADEKLRHSMRRFADIHGCPAALVLVSGDINFAPDVCDLRHRKKIHVILVHNEVCSESLILCANESYKFSSLCEDLPYRSFKSKNTLPAQILVRNLPNSFHRKMLRKKLRSLSENCGGRVKHISDDTAIIHFSSVDTAKRAQKRLEGEMVFGNQISVGYPRRLSENKKAPEIRKAEELGQLFGVNSSLKSSTNWFQPYEHSNMSEIEESHAANLLLSNQENLFFKPNGSDQPWPWRVVSEEAPRAPTNFLSSKTIGNGLGKGRPVLTTKNEASNNKDFYQLSKGSDFVKQWEGKRAQNGQRVPTAEREGLHFKRSRVASPKPQRKSADLRTAKNKPPGLTGRKCRTPSPYSAVGSAPARPASGLSRKSLTPFSEQTNEKYFSPIQPGPNHPVELHITNLDQSIEPSEMRKTLLGLFGEHTTVVHAYVFTISDGTYAASVKVPCLENAQLVISQLHRRKIGFKRILISYAHTAQPQNPQYIRWQIVNLLQEVPENQLPLCKFLELFETRYNTTVSVSELHRLRDVCLLTDTAKGRMICLNPEHRDSPSPNFTSQDIEPFCTLHYRENRSINKGWAEQEATALPNVKEPLKRFSENIIRLIKSHHNALPLLSIVNCYEAECGPLTVYDGGVPLEHLVSCIDGVELIMNNGVKYLKRSLPHNQTEDSEDLSKSVSPAFQEPIMLFGREIVDLLRITPHCQLLFNKFIPAYHHHFGRQCRVASYGFTKLIELLEAVPTIVQVFGEGNKRMVTLSHKAQMRRFTSDLLRVMKALPSKRMTIMEIPKAFERVLNRSFDPVDYGLCELEDLVDQLSENTVQVVRSNDAVVLSMPKKDQTHDEKVRTKHFAKEVIELLSLLPQCSILFNKFIPAYHHHYGHQCRLANFGFTKLIELFEAIPEIVTIEEDADGEKRVSLTPTEKLKVLGDQISDLVAFRFPPGLLVSNLAAAFLWQHGYALKPENYGATSFLDLIDRLNTVKMVEQSSGNILVPVQKPPVKEIKDQILFVLLQSPKGRVSLSQLRTLFDDNLEAERVESLMGEMVKMEYGSDVQVVLNDLHQVARQIVVVLLKADGNRALYSNLADVYTAAYGTSLVPSQYGFNSLSALLGALPHIFTVRGKGNKRYVSLSKTVASVKLKLSPTKIFNRDSSYDSVLSLEDSNSVGHNSWIDSFWSNTQYDSQIPVVQLPEMTTPPADIMETSSLISPCKSLLPATSNPLFMFPSEPSSVVPPDPSELPLPDMYSKKIFSTKDDPKPAEPDSRASSTKRRLRLAAQFQTPLQLSDDP